MKRKMTKLFSLAASMFIAVAILILPLQSAAAAPAPGKVDLVLLPAAQTVNIGDTITVTVQAQCGTQTTDGIETHLNFNPAYLAVQSITAGTTLTLPLQNTYDNTAGTLDFSAGSITPVTGTFTVATIAFTAKSVVTNTSTPVTFNSSGGRTTMVTLVGSAITGVLTGATYTINAPADTTPPTVQSIIPANSATGVAVGTTVAVTFSEAMNQSATQGAFSLTPAAAGTFGWNAGGTVMTFTPAASLALNTPYNVGIAVAATDLAGNHLATAYSSTFTTQASVPTAPVVATAAATAITYTTATLNGNLTSLGTASPVSVYFEYGYTTAYGNTTPHQSLTVTGTFNAPVTVFFPVVTWHYRAVAVGTTTVYGADMTFTTTNDATTPYGPAKFAFVSARDGNNEIYGITPDGKYTARLTNDAFDEEWPRFAPTFTKITYTSWASGSPQIWVMNPDGTGQTQITTGTAFNGMSEFSWDGTKIVFVSNSSGQYQIYSMNADGTNVTRLTNDAYIDLMPSWSPDLTKLAFVSNRTGSYQIFIMNLADSTVTQLTNSTGVNLYPSWLVDGTKMSFSSTRSGTSEIYTMNADGSAQTLLTADGKVNDQSAWCPTGGAIFYTSLDTANVPQIMFVGMGPNAGAGPYAFTANPQGNWSRSNWALPTFQTFTVAASVTGGHGTVAVAPVTQPMLSGTSASITSTPDTGYHIASITDNGTAVAIANPYVISSVTAAHTVVVTFSNAATFTITASAGANGAISPTGAVVVNSGANQIFTITANNGFVISTLTVDGAAVTPVVSTYTFTNVLAAHTIAATFAASGSGTVIVKAVAAGADDGFSSNPAGAFNPANTWWEAGSPAAGISNNAWFRFTGITIPANAIIDSAYLQTIESRFDSGTKLMISAEKIASSIAPTSTANQAAKVRTTASVAWTSGFADAGWHNSPDFTAVIQELLANYSYNNGAITILVDNNASTTGAEAAGATFENTGFAPVLHITYHISASVVTGAATNLTTSGATLNGNLASLGADTSANVSFQWRLSTQSTYSNETTVQNMSGTGAFFFNLTGLSAGTTYVYRAKAVGTASGTLTGAEVNFTTSSSGGGGPPIVVGPPPPPAGYVDLSSALNNGGTCQSSDGKVGFTIAKGTKLTLNGTPVTSITINPSTNKQTLPAGSDTIGLPYDIQPEGTTIDPGITVTFSYAGLDLGTFAEKKLMLAWWDPAAKQWVKLTDSVVDTGKKTITATLKHFSLYTIMGYPLAPAAFTTGGLTVTPASAEVGDPVTVAFSVTNTGEVSGTYTAALMVNGNATANKTVTLNAGETQTVTFTVNQPQAGTYTISVGNMNATITFLRPAAFTIGNLILTPASVEVGKPVTVTISVTNTGEVSGTYTAALMVNGSPEATKDVTLEGGETQQVSFTVNRAQAGTYNVSIDTLNDTITYLTPAAFVESNLAVSPTNAEPGSDITISYDVSNTGEAPGTYTSALLINTEQYDSKAIRVNPGETQRMTYTVKLVKPASYDFTVGSFASTFTYLKPAAFTASNLGITPANIKKGDIVTINYDVTNTGEISGSYTATLKVDGTVVGNSDITLAGGEVKTVSFEIVVGSAGTYALDAAGLTGSLAVTQFNSAWLWVGVGGAFVVVILLITAILATRRNRRVSGMA